MECNCRTARGLNGSDGHTVDCASRPRLPLVGYEITFDNGDTLRTSMAGHVTLWDAEKYYIGKRFEITETTFRTAVSVKKIY